MGARMSEQTKKRSRPRKYRPRKNAINITVYDPHGQALPKEAINEVEVALGSIALKYKLLTARNDS